MNIISFILHAKRWLKITKQSNPYSNAYKQRRISHTLFHHFKGKFRRNRMRKIWLVQNALKKNVYVYIFLNNGHSKLIIIDVNSAKYLWNWYIWYCWWYWGEPPKTIISFNVKLLLRLKLWVFEFNVTILHS